MLFIIDSDCAFLLEGGQSSCSTCPVGSYMTRGGCSSNKSALAQGSEHYIPLCADKIGLKRDM
jgi:hypothetical protein